jgi:trimeric autotransporter adhesin
MNSRNIILTTMLLALGCFALCPTPETFGVVPPPDGGYAGFNTAEGTNALKSLTTGVGDTVVGWFSLFSNTDGSFNTGVGAGTLLFNVGDQSTGEGVSNMAIGTAALLLNTTGTEDTAVGTATLVNSSIGDSNSAFGAFALNKNDGGDRNTAIGDRALFNGYWCGRAW